MGERGVVSEVALAISARGRVAIVKRSDGRVELYDQYDGGDDARPANITIKENLVRPYNVCFAPNNHLVVTDVGDNCVKIYSLDREPHLMEKIICYEKEGENIIVMARQVSSPYRYLTPFNIIAGPEPFSQLFLDFENHIFMITIDWNTVELVDYRQLSSPGDWSSVQLKARKECNKTSIVYDHKDNHKVGGQNPLAVTKAQFCAMFYHVTEKKKDSIGFKCLHRSSCRVGKMTTHWKPEADYAATVVVYVRLTDIADRLIFHARYGNCFEGKRRNTIHAEYFMLVDEEFREGVRFLRDQKAGNINMYMNKQPCFRSTKHHSKGSGLKRKECAQDLVNFYNLYCSSHGITLTINLCQLYKVDMPPSPTLKKDIQNAQQGMLKMISAGIELKAMTEESWERLARYAGIELPVYKDGERQKLDQHIAEFLHNILPG